MLIIYCLLRILKNTTTLSEKPVSLFIICWKLLINTPCISLYFLLDSSVISLWVC